MRVGDDGNVGIGTAAPAAKLEVNGTAKFNDLVTFAPGQDFSTTSGTVLAATGAFTGSTSNQVLSVTQSGAGAAAVLNNTTGGPILSGQNNGSQVFSVGGSGNLQAANLHASGTNSFVGPQAGNLTMTGTYNTGTGNLALSANDTGTYNTATGYSTLGANTTGYYNTATGAGALSLNTSGFDNTAAGVNALGSNTSGSYNIASGVSALYRNTTGVDNTAIGVSALTWNSSGNYNIAIGINGLFYNTDADGNAAIGAFALQRNCWNVLSGCAADYNTAIGYQAGVTTTIGNANVTGSNNTFIGSNSGPGTSTQLDNATAIGANALVSASNALVLGASGVNVGIGTQSPAHTLDVVGTGNFTGAVTAGSFAGDGSGLTNLPGGTATDLNCLGCVAAPELAFDPATQTELDAEASLRGAADTTLQSNISSEASTRTARDNALSVRGINYLAGCDTCGVLTDADDQRTIYVNLVGAMTINSVTCFSDAGAPTINLQRDDGTPANVLTSNLTCSTSGVTSTSISGPEGVLNLNDRLDFVMVTAGGVAKRVTVVTKATLN